MWSEKLSREEFVDLVGRRRRIGPDLFLNGGERKPDRPPRGDDLWSIWPDQESYSRDLPTVIVLADERVEDFLAWVATFLQNIQPFTSYFRVLSWGQFETSTRVFPRSPGSSGAEPLLGVLLGEALSQTRARAALATMPLQGFASMLSYPLARACLVNWPDVESIAAVWDRIQRTSDGPERLLGSREPLGVWQIVSRIWRGDNRNVAYSGTESTIFRACEALISRQDLAPAIIENLLVGRTDLPGFRRAMSESRELRVRAFSEIVSSVIGQPRNEQFDSFLCGYAASLISEGTLDHADLLFPLLKDLPTVVMWYGFCAGAARESRIKESYGGLGFRLLRDLTRDESLFSRPTADISEAELTVISRGRLALADIRQSGASSLSVELAPRVIGVFRSSQKAHTAFLPKLAGIAESPEIIESLIRLSRLIEEAASVNDKLLSRATIDFPKNELRRRLRGKIS